MVYFYRKNNQKPQSKRLVYSILLNFSLKNATLVLLQKISHPFAPKIYTLSHSECDRVFTIELIP